MTHADLMATEYHMNHMVMESLKTESIIFLGEDIGVYRFDIGDDITIEVYKKTVDKRVADARSKNNGVKV